MIPLVSMVVSVYAVCALAALVYFRVCRRVVLPIFGGAVMIHVGALIAALGDMLANGRTDNPVTVIGLGVGGIGIVATLLTNRRRH